MNDNEATVISGRIQEILQSFRLNWVADQANQAIREGVLVEQEVQTESAPKKRAEAAYVEDIRHQRRRGARAKFLKPREMTVYEQLRLLIDTVDNAVAAPTEMAADFLNTFDSDNMSRVVLIHEQNDDSTKKIHLSSNDIRSCQDAVQLLRRLLEELRAEVN